MSFLNTGSREIRMIKATYIRHCGDDLAVVNAARVSYGKESQLECIDMVKGKYVLKHQDEKLIKFLAREEHTSPFNHAFATFHVKAPIYVARQLQKHSYMPWNEISRRYVKTKPEFYEPVWRSAAEDKKQGSGGNMEHQEAPHIINLRNYKEAVKDYFRLLEIGVCEEQARQVLPQSLMTEWHWSGTMFAFARMCNLRCKPDAQAETRIVADEIDQVMAKLFPASWKALRK